MADDALDTLLDLQARVAQLERERTAFVPRPGPGLLTPVHLIGWGHTVNSVDGAWHDVPGAIGGAGGPYVGFNPAEFRDGGYTQVRGRADLYQSSGGPPGTGYYGVGCNEVFVGWKELCGFAFNQVTPGTVLHLDTGWVAIPANILNSSTFMAGGYIYHQAGVVMSIGYNFTSLEVR